MRRLITFMCTLTTLTCVTPSPSDSQGAFDYLRQALVKTVVSSGLMYDYDYKNNLCLAGILLNQGEYGELSFNFNAGDRYRILGIADEDVQDCDLFLYDVNGNEITKDTRTDNFPIIHYQAVSSGARTIRIQNYSSSDVAFCIIVIMRYKYFGCEPRSGLLAQALHNAITLAEVSSLSGTTFAPRTWCLFGGLYSSGESDGILNFKTQFSGTHVFLGAGSNNVRDVDVFAIQQDGVGSTSGSTKCKDNDSDKAALVSCYLSSYEKYHMKYQNYDSQGEAFVFGVVLKK